jgi:thymidylate synthase (FAD)
MDRFTVALISQTPNPQQVIYGAMHQDYAEGFVWDERDRWPDEEKCGEIIVRQLLQGNRGHYGPLEHPQIVLNCGWFPHSTMQQVRTHRVGVSFDVQCLAGDTEVTFVDASGASYTRPIADLYADWMSDRQFLRHQLRVLNEKTGIFETSHIKRVMSSGVQPVYRLTLEDGRTLDCTRNHRLLTTEGWQTMGDAVGLHATSEGHVLTTTRVCAVMTNGMVVDAAQAQNPRETVSSTVHSHHLKAHPVSVTQVHYLGMQSTYDLEVEDPWHNFVANGVVVHNSFRYTGQRILDVIEGKRELEDVFYLRPVGSYSDRQGKKYDYTADLRQEDLDWCLQACHRYAERIHQGFAEEHARGLIPFDIRQHWVMSANVRSLMHLLDLRWKADAQLEAQKLCEQIWPHFQAWVPAIAAWYEANRLKKARLSP